MTERYVVVYEWSGRNFGGFAPDVPGCGVTGQSLNEVRDLLRDGLQLHFQALANDGLSIPGPVSRNYQPEVESEGDFDIPGYYYVVEKLDISMPFVRAELVSA